MGEEAYRTSSRGQGFEEVLERGCGRVGGELEVGYGGVENVGGMQLSGAKAGPSPSATLRVRMTKSAGCV